MRPWVRGWGIKKSEVGMRKWERQEVGSRYAEVGKERR